MKKYPDSMNVLKCKSKFIPGPNNLRPFYTPYKICPVHEKCHVWPIP